MLRRAIIAQHSLALTFSAVHLNISLYSHILRVGICQHQINHQATTQPLPPASHFVSDEAAGHTCCALWLLPRHSAGLACGACSAPTAQHLAAVPNSFHLPQSCNHIPPAPLMLSR